MQWYYARDGQQFGPFTEETLILMARDGQVRRGDHVWNSSFGSRWMPAATVPGLFAEDESHLPPLQTPPLPPAAGGHAVSLLRPLATAWQQMTATLFRPFELGHWFALGFSAWLAHLLENVASFSGLLDGGQDRHAGTSLSDMVTQLEQSYHANRNLFIASGATGVAVALVAGLAVTWLRCRGKFMLLDNLLHQRDLIRRPWVQFRTEAVSLFRFAFLFGLCASACWLAVGCVTAWLVVVPCARAHAFTGTVLPAAFVLGGTTMLLAVLFGYVRRFCEDFIVPIMYHRRLGVWQAWRVFADLFAQQTANFLVYGIFHFLLMLATRLGILAVVLATCCVAGCLLSVPYVGAVTLLPVTVFLRFYSLCYLAQFGPGFTTAPRAEASAR